MSEHSDIRDSDIIKTNLPSYSLFYHNIYVVKNHFDMESKEMWIIFLYEFKLDRSATRSMNIAFGEGSASDRIIRR